MNIKRRVLILLLAVALAVGSAFPAAAAAGDDCVAEMISYYSHYEQDAQLDIALLLAELAGIDGAKAAAWEHIMGFWMDMDSRIDVGCTTLPEGLPENDSLCILVMGYQLKSNGGLREELVGRLETALAAAEQYPNAYIACTGGPTAEDKDWVSEAGQMARWLMDHGVEEERIIVEDDSLSTVSNAKYTCRILYDQYPQIRQLAVITSDYHVKRSSLYFTVQAQLEALERGVKPLTVAGTAAWQTRRGDEEDLHLQVEGTAQLAGVSQPGRRAPEKSRLTHIQVSGETRWPVGMELELQVRAFYSTGRSRDVSYVSKLSGFDLGSPGQQQVTVTYQEAGEICKAQFQIELWETAEEMPREEVTATAVAEAVPETTEPAAEPGPSASGIWLLLIPAALLLWLGWRKKKQGP